MFRTQQDDCSMSAADALGIGVHAAALQMASAESEREADVAR